MVGCLIDLMKTTYALAYREEMYLGGRGEDKVNQRLLPVLSIDK